MEKYKAKLLENIRKQLQSWYKVTEEINGKELDKFLHSLAGTAPTIGLQKIGDAANLLMKKYKEIPEEMWSAESIQQFLSPLLAVAYDEDAVDLKGEALSKKYTPEEKDLIMLIDDDPALLIYLKDKLENEGFTVMAFTEAKKALKAFFDLDPSCVIIDVHMQEKSGLEILEEFKRYTNFRFIPAVMISVDDSKETRMKSYQLDADDFIPKPFEMDELIVRVRRLVTKKKHLKELIMLDELTRVYTRKHLSPSFKRIAEQMNREQQPFSAAMIDLDHFKSINDTYGHLMGDRVLAGFANLLKQNLRTGDLPFRYGGEEFLILFPRTDVKTASLVLNRVLNRFMDHPFETDGESFRVSFSAGVSAACLSEGLENTVKAADHALYKAKQTGRAKTIAAEALAPIEAVRKKLRFAVVDDDPIIRTILQDLFQNSSLNEKFLLDVQAFEDGLQFLQSEWHLKDPESSSFIVLDGMMPEIDGIEVLKVIRSLKHQERFTVVMLTNRTSEEDITTALKLGADDYLTKPFKLAEIESRIFHLIKKISS
ncbi:diguanylate cyclase [Metabacillus sp. KIGAM252]|uniref:Diguanylate cyclase n=1 Tax=Metabacillus flavus TaxID=2823519 RepID=A0ABS5LHS0_9BACI|nr:response regulator [Metabacillus flavus]MBS2970290.1 diguanylate cyclase [Metabacillus flavus]